MTEPKRSLHKKLAQVMYEVDRIPKNGTAPQAMGGFKFVQVGDATDVIRKALAEHSITMMPTALHVVGQAEHATKAGGSMTTVDIVMDWTLTDGDSGETITIQSFGAGADGGDKYSGKAQTNAMKYALLMGFLLSTGDDVELGDTSARGKRRYPGLVDGDPPEATAPEREVTHDGSLIGTVTAGKPPVDLEMRQTPDGPICGFKLTQGRSGIQVLASGPLAEALYPMLAGLRDQRVSVWGSVEMVQWAKDGKDMPPYRRLNLERIVSADFILPTDNVEAPTASLFPDEPDADEAAAIAAAEKAEAAA